MAAPRRDAAPPSHPAIAAIEALRARLVVWIVGLMVPIGGVAVAFGVDSALQGHVTPAGTTATVSILVGIYALLIVVAVRPALGPKRWVLLAGLYLVGSWDLLTSGLMSFSWPASCLRRASGSRRRLTAGQGWG